MDQSVERKRDVLYVAPELFTNTHNINIYNSNAFYIFNKFLINYSNE